jgi:hypothetical protein
VRLLDVTPEDGIKENWRWQTDALVSSNATEQRISNSSLPKRTFALNLKFDDANELRRNIAALFIGGKTKFQAPLYQYATRLKAAAIAGDTTLSILSGRTELRAGKAALIFDRNGSQLLTVDSLLSASATFLEPLARPYGVDASVCPVATVFAGNNAAISYGFTDEYASATLNLNETDFLNPFVSEFNAAVVPTFNGLPLLTARPVGTNFQDHFDTGIQPTDEGGVIDVRSPWTHAQIQMARDFTCQRKFNPDDWDYWRAFADAVKGSWKPFYMPTYRQDFAVVTPPAPGGNTLTFAGTFYADDWFPYAPFKALAIFSDGGVHYTTVTAAVSDGTNTNVTLGTALPGGGAYASNQRISLLQKVRIADDLIACDHYGLFTRLTLNIRTVDA